MRVGLLAVGIALALAGSADAAVVRFAVYAPTQPSAGDPVWPVALMNVDDESSAGEANDLHIGYDAGSDEVVVRDDGPAPLSFLAGTGGICRLTDADHEVRCERAGAARLSATYRLEGGDDRAVVGFGPTWIQEVTLNAGAGDDAIELTGGGRVWGDSGDDTITLLGTAGQAMGDDGDDVITGSPGADRLFGGEGDDWIDGGDGDDRIEDASGASWPGAHDDDVFLGGAGADTIVSQDGSDQLSGGAGYDHLLARDATGVEGPDTLDCGVDGGTYDIDADDVMTGCGEPCPYATCGEPPPLTDPSIGMGSGGGSAGAGGGGSAAAHAPVTEPSAEPPASAPPIPVSPRPAPAPLTVRFALDATRARLPLHHLPRGLIALSDTAAVRVTLARAQHGRWVTRSGHIDRRLGTGARSISLAVLLGRPRHLPAGRYRLSIVAVTADGRRATASTALRVLAARRR